MNCCIGIDIATRGIRLAWVSRRRGSRILRGTWARDLPSGEVAVGDAGMDALLEEALRGVHLRASANVVVGLPCRNVFFHDLTTELERHEDVRRMVKFELEDDFPVSFEDLIVDICGHYQKGEREHKYLIAAVNRSEITGWNRVVEKAGRRCSVHTTDVCALEAVARAAQLDSGDAPLVLLHADGQRAILGILCQGNLLVARHFVCSGPPDAVGAMLSREVELTCRCAFGRECRQTSRILLSGPDEFIRPLSGRLSEETDRDVQLVDLSSVIQSPDGSQPDGQFTVALGLALMGLSPAGHRLDFLNADTSQADRLVRSKAKRGAMVAGALLAVILALSGVGAIREFTRLETEHAGLRREIRAVFLEVCPQEKKIVNELAQMTEHLSSLQKERDTLAKAIGERIHPLRILHILSEKLASDKEISISLCSIKDRAVYVTGTGAFESVERFMEELRQVPEFSSVELEDVTRSRSADRPEFRLLIKVKDG